MERNYVPCYKFAPCVFRGRHKAITYFLQFLSPIKQNSPHFEQCSEVLNYVVSILKCALCVLPNSIEPTDKPQNNFALLSAGFHSYACSIILYGKPDSIMNSRAKFCLYSIIFFIVLSIQWCMGLPYVAPKVFQFSTHEKLRNQYVLILQQLQTHTRTFFLNKQS